MIDKVKVLAVDDEKEDLFIITKYLEDAGYQAIPAEDGLQAWEYLEQNPDEIGVILLDRMMPKMSGMALLHEIKTSPSFADIPVIIQTALNSEEDIKEGLEAGAYYYLTKPFDKHKALSIVNAAIQDVVKQNTLREETTKARLLGKMTRHSNFTLRTPEEAQLLAAHIANAYPEPEHMVSGISEMLANAIEHGNLGIGFTRKTELYNEGTWKEELNHLLNLPQNARKLVKVTFERKPSELVLTIEDEGKGFDWKPFLKLDPSRATHSHGRGIALSAICFDSIAYTQPGNSVTCNFNLKYT